MIAACPKCNARYRVDPTKVGPDGARLRCAKCQAVFRVRAPGNAPAAPAASAPAPVTAPAREPTPAPTAPAALPQADDQVDPERLVLIADSDSEAGKRSAAALSGWGLQPIVVQDGVEAMLAIQRMMPRLVVLDAALPKMYGFQVCEIVKRNDSLRHIKVVLVGAIHDRDRYRRPPAELYGADVYLERPDLPDGLAPLLRQYGLELRDEPGAAVASAPVAAPPPPRIETPTAAAPPTPPQPAPSPAPTAPAPANDGLSDERAQAERLARIIVSDIILYNPEKFEEAVRNGNVVEALDAGLEEGRGFFCERIPASVRDEKDFLVEELLRVARERGMK